MENKKQELIDFLKYVMEVHTNKNGMLEICAGGDELAPTVENVVKKYLKKISVNEMAEQNKEQELIDFLKYVMEVHTNKNGMLEICAGGPEPEPTVEYVVKRYLEKISDNKMIKQKDGDLSGSINIDSGSCRTLVINDSDNCIHFGCTTGYLNLTVWNDPELIKFEIVGESIEVIYKETSRIIHYSYPDQRVFKVIYSCKDGKWNESERIYGTIIPATDESYDFE